MNAPLLEFDAVSKRFTKSLDAIEKLARALGAPVSGHTVHAVDRVSFAIGDGEVVGLVGESGCGKSTLGRIGCGLHEPTEGAVRYRGKPLQAGGGERPPIQMIFQDPFASLNPRMRVAEIVGEAPRVHGIVDRGQVDDYVADLLRRVGLDPAFSRRYPHQFSGGQRARIGIARALAVKPEFLVCDEAVAALDVSIQAQVLNLFMDLRDEFGLTYLFISHDLSVVRHMANRIGVLYLGRLAEVADGKRLFTDPQHPYSRMLLDAVPDLAMSGRRRKRVEGEIPNPIDPPSGCTFHPRCPLANARCKAEEPRPTPTATGGSVACFAVEEARV